MSQINLCRVSSGDNCLVSSNFKTQTGVGRGADGSKQPLNHQQNPHHSPSPEMEAFLSLNFKIHKLSNTDKYTKITKRKH